jgi:exodeoxyribonuclease V gamma subunit
MREIEVLFDQLLAMLDQDPALKPEDILVMAPDIETYAPFIHAVFDRLAESDFPHAKAPHLPYNLSDRNVLRESVLIEPFLYFLTLPESRFGVLQIVKLLETEVIRKKLQWGEEDVLQIKNWIKETQIKWGIDGQDKVRQSLPPYVQNTWRSGIEQLLLGYAMSGEDLLHGILPYEKIDLSQASTLGTFISFIEEFFAFIELLRSPRSLSAWAGILNTALEQFFLYDELPVKELSLVQSALNQLREKQELAGYDAHLELEVIRSLLKDDLTREKMGHNFLSGGITFCDLLPMRSIPFKVICLLGMNDKAFPRITHTVGFDLMARDFKPGDRSTALSDRYLFLETILSAGDRLYISYIGQNIQDNSEYPPSVAISELLDTIRAGFKLEEATINQTTPPIPLAEKIQTKHRLQAFSTAYFSNHKPPDLMDSKNPSQYLSQGLFSFSKENYQASLAFLNKTSEKKTFLTDTLSPPEEGFKQVSVDELSYFFSHPTKFFMNQRLGLYLDQAVPELDERESFALTGLDRYQLKQNLITRLLSGQEIEPYYRIINAHGLLPHGNLGESYYQTSIQEVQIFLDKFNSLNKGQEIKPLKIDCSLQMFRISGDIPLWENGFFHYRCAPVKTKDRLKLWITHLVLNYYLKQAGTLPVCTTSTYLGEDECFSLNPIEDCEKKLLYLLECYWSGLSYLLPFFPDTSYEFTQSMVKKLPHLPENLNYYPKDMYQETEQWALNAAQKKWLGNDYASGEQDDLYYQLGYRNINPLDKKFMELALNIYLPLLKASL